MPAESRCNLAQQILGEAGSAKGRPRPWQNARRGSHIVAADCKPTSVSASCYFLMRNKSLSPPHSQSWGIEHRRQRDLEGRQQRGLLWLGSSFPFSFARNAGAQTASILLRVQSCEGKHAFTCGHSLRMEGMKSSLRRDPGYE